MKATGIFAWAHGYVLGTHNDTICVYDRNSKLVTQQHVEGLHAFLMQARILRFGWGQFPNNGDEVIYLFDEADENFGYAVNLNDPQCSEWGYAPFDVEKEVAI